MPVIYFINSADGKKYKAEAEIGETLMAAAVKHNIPRIIGECGGVCACGTCHIYLGKEAAILACPVNMHEDDMLSLLDKVKPSSRLSCQIAVTEYMDGICIYLP